VRERCHYPEFLERRKERLKTLTKKSCMVCKVEKELKEYYKHQLIVDGYYNECKKCISKKNKEKQKLMKKALEYYNKRAA
jgi:hypothetical protein